MVRSASSSAAARLRAVPESGSPTPPSRLRPNGESVSSPARTAALPCGRARKSNRAARPPESRAPRRDALWSPRDKVFELTLIVERAEFVDHDPDLTVVPVEISRQQMTHETVEPDVMQG